MKAMKTIFFLEPKQFPINQNVKNPNTSLAFNINISLRPCRYFSPPIMNHQTRIPSAQRPLEKSGFKTVLIKFFLSKNTDSQVFTSTDSIQV